MFSPVCFCSHRDLFIHFLHVFVSFFVFLIFLISDYEAKLKFSSFLFFMNVLADFISMLLLSPPYILT